MEVSVVWRHWCVEVQTEGFQEQNEVSEIFVDGCTQLLDGLTSFVGEVEGTVPMRDVNLGATIHQVIRDDDLREGVVEEGINGEKNDN